MTIKEHNAICERIKPIKECKTCEYCNLFENKCFITDEFCYENKKCKHENCDNYIKGKWKPQMC